MDPVVNCYWLLDIALLIGHSGDYTEGIYDGDPQRSYGEAQKRQAEYLLDQIGCREGSTILDIGCGNGRILKAAKARGAKAIGITISPEQVKRDKDAGLDVRLLNYRDIPDDWNGKFDGIIANGSLEHFVQPKEAIAGESDDVYVKIFETCHRLLKPGGRFATTAIHFHRVPVADELILSPYKYPKGSDQFNYSMLFHYFGGFYPVKGQLQKCASPFFLMETEVDGTEDYRRTSEEWLNFMKKEFLKPKGFSRLFFKFLRHPIYVSNMLNCIVFSQSWGWQFSGDDPPTRLYRHTWVRKE